MHNQKNADKAVYMNEAETLHPFWNLIKRPPFHKRASFCFPALLKWIDSRRLNSLGIIYPEIRNRSRLLQFLCAFIKKIKLSFPVRWQRCHVTGNMYLEASFIQHTRVVRDGIHIVNKQILRTTYVVSNQT